MQKAGFQSILWWFAGLIFVSSCANISSPSGGPRDEVPPMLDTLRSTTNYQTNFQKQDIELYFDEYVEIKDIFTQVVISPPLEKRWQLKQKLKKVTFQFHEDEVLRENATYTINFGEAIRDFTEGNPAADLRFVFSTGPFIDSMEVSGQIIDAITKEPAEEMLVMLYDNLSDTVVRTERPFYFAKTDKQGEYTIKNVKADTFKVFALQDADLNYLFNQDSELIGFPDSNFILSGTRNRLPTFAVFQERPSPRLISKEVKTFGKVSLAFNLEPYDIIARADSSARNLYFDRVGDSLNVWYNQSNESEWSIFLNRDTNYQDTVLVKPTERAAFFEEKKLLFDGSSKSGSISLNPARPILLSFNHPLESIAQARIQLLEDSLRTPVTGAEFTFEGRELKIEHKWQEGAPYELVILPNALEDIFGLKNQDTIARFYQVMREEDFGNFKIQVNELDSASQYVLRLLFKNSDTLVDSWIVQNANTHSLDLAYLPPGKYFLEIVTDWNKNGRWDSGNYDLQLQPEPIFTKALEELRAGWQVEAGVDLK